MIILFVILGIAIFVSTVIMVSVTVVAGREEQKLRDMVEFAAAKNRQQEEKATAVVAHAETQQVVEN